MFKVKTFYWCEAWRHYWIYRRWLMLISFINEWGEWVKVIRLTCEFEQLFRITKDMVEVNALSYRTSLLTFFELITFHGIFSNAVQCCLDSALLLICARVTTIIDITISDATLGIHMYPASIFCWNYTSILNVLTITKLLGIINFDGIRCAVKNAEL